MNKRELLDNMRGRVADIRDGMSKVEENLYVISDCIDEKKFLSPETTGSVRENLEKIEEMFRSMIAGPGSARRTVEQYMAE